MEALQAKKVERCRIMLLFPEHEVYRAYQQGKRHQVIPAEWFFQKKYCEEREYGKGDNFLDGFELKAAPAFHIAKSVGRYHEAVFKEGDAPAEEDYFPEGGFGMFEVPVPGERHEGVGDDQ